MSQESKEEIVKQLVKYQAQLFERRFERIRNIFEQHSGSDKHQEGLKQYTILSF
jgi:hypothetical protein